MYRGSAWLAASRQAWAVWRIVFVQYLQLIPASQAQVASNVLRSQSEDTRAPAVTRLWTEERGGTYSDSDQAISDTCSLMMTQYLQQPSSRVVASLGRKVGGRSSYVTTSYLIGLPPTFIRQDTLWKRAQTDKFQGPWLWEKALKSAKKLYSSKRYRLFLQK